MIRGLPHKMAHLTDGFSCPDEGCPHYGTAHGHPPDAPALANQTCTSPEAIHPLWAGLTKPPHGTLRKQGYDGIWFELRNEAGEPVSIGSSVRAHRRDEYEKVVGGMAPHKPESTGRVYVSHGQYFPGVYDLEWVPL